LGELRCVTVRDYATTACPRKDITRAAALTCAQEESPADLVAKLNPLTTTDPTQESYLLQCRAFLLFNQQSNHEILTEKGLFGMASTAKKKSRPRYSVCMRFDGKVREIGISTDKAQAIRWAKKDKELGLEVWVWDIRTGATVYGRDAEKAMTREAGGQ
jgi:hypothetical protein